MIPALGRQRQANFLVQGQPGLQSEFQYCQLGLRGGLMSQRNKNKTKTNKTKQKSIVYPFICHCGLDWIWNRLWACLSGYFQSAERKGMHHYHRAPNISYIILLNKAGALLAYNSHTIQSFKCAVRTRVGSQVRSTHRSCRGPEFSSQHPVRTAHNHL